LYAKTPNNSRVSLFNEEPEGISYDKLAYFDIPRETICATTQCFWASEKQKNSFLYQVMLRQSRD
jgi:hypothetical protein